MQLVVLAGSDQWLERTVLVMQASHPSTASSSIVIGSLLGHVSKLGYSRSSQP